MLFSYSFMLVSHRLHRMQCEITGMEQLGQHDTTSSILDRTVVMTDNDRLACGWLKA